MRGESLTPRAEVLGEGLCRDVEDDDLGVVTGRYAGELPADAQELVETAQELDQAIAADAERVAEPTEDQK